MPIAPGPSIPSAPWSIQTDEEKSTEVPPGGVLLFNSDGISEAHGPGREMFGSARLAELAARRLDGAALIRLVLDELDQFTGPHWEQEDDITLVALERAAADPAVPWPVEERPTRRTAGERPKAELTRGPAPGAGGRLSASWPARPRPGRRPCGPRTSCWSSGR